MQADFAFLTSLGWGPHFSAQFDPKAGGESLPGRVISSAKQMYLVQVAPRVVLRAEISGRYAHQAAGSDGFPVVGDWVVCKPIDTDRAVIHKVLVRKTLLARKAAGSEFKKQALAANVDTAFIVCSLNADFNLRRIERYLTLVKMSGAKPVVVLTKADLAEDFAPMLADVGGLDPGLLVYVVSSRSGFGIDELKAHLEPGTTSVLLGSSGAGKSTLINRLFGEEVAKTGEIRDDDDRGRHTTTSRNLLMSPEGALMIDTPGMRELQIWDDGHGLEAVFGDIEELALQCKFTDCRHDSESGCRIRAALASGELAPERLENFRKLRNEAAAQRRKVETSAGSAENQKRGKRHADAREQIKRGKRGENF